MLIHKKTLETLVRAIRAIPPHLPADAKKARRHALYREYLGISETHRRFETPLRKGSIAGFYKGTTFLVHGPEERAAGMRTRRQSGLLPPGLRATLLKRIREAIDKNGTRSHDVVGRLRGVSFVIHSNT